jgi:hypothetical protein
MRFIVHGVDRTAGQDSTLPLDAANAGEAESIASLTMLVADVMADQAPVQSVPYAQPNVTAGGFDWPAGILRQARVLRALSWVVAAVGALGIVATLASVFAATIDSTALAEMLRFLRLIAAADIGSSIWLLVLACLMRLAAHFMLGLRELLLRKIDRDN